MEKQYWLHRISHEWQVAYPLLEKGYLSIGWSNAKSTDVLSHLDDGQFETIMSSCGYSGRGKWGLWRFCKMKAGDWVVVPRFGKEFSIFEVTGPARSVTETELNGLTVSGLNGKVYQADEAGFPEADIGFVIPGKVLVTIPRSYALPDLISRMKVRQTNCDISDLAESVEAARLSKRPISVHDVIFQKISGQISDVLSKSITPDHLENVIKWYMLKMGADRATKPAKNDPTAQDGADADVVAEFDDLGLRFYIQAKQHRGTTSEWAVNQVKKYKEQHEDVNSGITFIAWVISTAEDFSESAIAEAEEAGVRLIGGTEFAEMLMNSGINSIDDSLQ